MRASDREAIQNRARAFFFELLMEYRQIPPEDVLSAVLSLPELRAAGRPSYTITPKRKPQAPGEPPTRSSPSLKHNLRTEEGRAAYDVAVLTVMNALGGEKLSAKQIREKAGGSSPQFRASVDRLIEAKKVVFEGKAAGMRYSLTNASKVSNLTTKSKRGPREASPSE